MQNIINEFKTAMLNSGIEPPDTIIGDGLLHRFRIDGRLNGAYVLHLDGCAAGYFQDFRQRIKQNWKLEGTFKRLTNAEKQAFAKQRQADDLKRQAEEAAKHGAAASKARQIWNQSPYAESSHHYLVTKKIGSHGVKIGFGNTLIIPLYKHDGELVSLQFIAPDGGKRFLSGGLKKGCFCVLGELTDKILICEGFATGASLFEDSGHMTFIAFDAGNLSQVAAVVSVLYQGAEVIVCGDNDESGVGQKAAHDAALACGGKYTFPPIAGLDWNDYINSKLVECSA